MTQRERITEIARRVRRAFGKCSTFQCIILSDMLADVLEDEGFNVKRVWGLVHVEGNYRTAWGHPPIDWDDEYDDIEYLDHHWVVVDGCWADIAADQFNDLMRPGNKFKAVMVGRPEEFPFHELFREVHRRDPS